MNGMLISTELAKRGQGRNKLRTYVTFKNEFCAEMYLCKPLSYNICITFSKLKCGTAPLHIKTSRFEQPRLEAHEKYCKVCNAENVEDEKHFFFLCPAFTDERQKLFHTVSTVYNGFNDMYMSNDEKFIFLMSEPSVYRFTAKTCT